MSSKVVQDEAVWGVVDQFQRETDPIRKHALRSLLIEQEDRFGTAVERLERADAHIAAGHFRIAEIETAAASLKARGRSTAAAELVLANLRELLAAFGGYRELVRQELDRRVF